MSEVEAKLKETCEQIYSSGFYVGFVSDVPDASKQDVVHNAKYASGAAWLEDCTAVVNPHGVTTAIYKVTSKLFRAFPICCKDDLSKFFDGHSWCKDVSGIVIVSHKLKMLSFMRACSNFSKTAPYAALWHENTVYAKNWLYWSNSISNNENCPYMKPNSLHMNYRSIFYNRHRDVYVAEICTSIEDHYKNDLFHERIAVENQIGDLEYSIDSAKTIISNMQKKIASLESTISNARDSLEKYEVDLYASRVNSDLGI